MKTEPKKTGPYVILPPKRPLLDVKDYILPTKWKHKKNISGRIDEILYGKGRK